MRCRSGPELTDVPSRARRNAQAWTRRELVRHASLALAWVATTGCRPSLPAATRMDSDPFTLGVASGSPLPDGVVLWTRLAPAPLEPGGGLAPEPVTVTWRVAEDEQLTRIVRQGTARATPELGHSVHVELRGLEPARPYWYRFEAGGAQSPVGRTRTAPASGSSVERLRLAYASCQHYETGYFNAYRAMLDDDLDLVVHLGDYIYENAARDGEVRRHEGVEPVDLDGYRARHALYKTDRDLQAAHAAYPWVLTWDDHEVDNDYAGDRSQDRDDPAIFEARRAAAYQAYYEHMPLRKDALPIRGRMQLYQRLAFGDLLDIHLLDTRQYRADQACGEGGPGGGRIVTDCPARLSLEQTMLGTRQRDWLLTGLGRSQARWNVIAQQMLMAELEQQTGPGEAYWTDGWDGYAGERALILRTIAQLPVPNVVVIGGDIHSFWATDLRPDFRDPSSPVVASEFVGTSITSRGIPYERFAAYLPENPHIRYFESRERGYTRCVITPDLWTTDFRAMQTVRQRASSARTLATFNVESGRPGLA